MSARTLSHRIEAIEYIHAKDGLPYRHDFTRGDSDVTLQNDGSVRIRNRTGKQLWDQFVVNGKTQDFLINPRGAKASLTRRASMAKKRRKLSAAQIRAGFGGKRKRNAPRKRRTAVAKVTRRRRARHTNPPVRARRRRRNPPAFSFGNILGMAMQGLKDGALVTTGKLGVRFISGQFGYDDGSMMDSAVELASALALGMLSGRVVGQDGARFVMAGGFDSVIETLIAQAGIPRVSNLLGSTTPMNTTAVYPPADVNSLRQVVLSGYGKKRLSGYGRPAPGNVGTAVMTA
jgi:hypothetical protein